MKQLRVFLSLVGLLSLIACGGGGGSTGTTTTVQGVDLPTQVSAVTATQ